MCGRFSLAPEAGAIEEMFPGVEIPTDLPKRYNIAPSQKVLAVAVPEGVRRMGSFRWGLIPSWASDPSSVHTLINARAETVNVKPTFRAAFRKRRCLVLADGFYEWRVSVTGSGKKVPYYIRPVSGGLMTFAGLWDRWVSPDGEQIQSCTLITTQANAAMAFLHERMPVIVPRETHDVWLDEAQPPERVLSLLHSCPDDFLTAWEVSTRVNNVRYNEADMVVPVVPGVGGESYAPSHSGNECGAPP